MDLGERSSAATKNGMGLMKGNAVVNSVSYGTASHAPYDNSLFQFQFHLISNPKIKPPKIPEL